MSKYNLHKVHFTFEGVGEKPASVSEIFFLKKKSNLYYQAIEASLNFAAKKSEHTYETFNSGTATFQHLHFITFSKLRFHERKQSLVQTI